MMGPDKGKDGLAPKEKGLYEMAAKDIFRLVNNKRYQHIGVYVSFFEIYGGRLFDLLNERRKLRNLEDHNKQVQIVGLRSERIQNIDDLFHLMEIGHSARSTGSTGKYIYIYTIIVYKGVWRCIKFKYLIFDICHVSS